MPLSWCLLSQCMKIKLCWHNAKCAFYRALMLSLAGVQAVLLQVVLHLVRSKCIPELLCGLDACPINATDFKSLQHLITNFATKSAEIVTECQQTFQFQPLRYQINCRKIKFIIRYAISPNQIYIYIYIYIHTPLFAINAL